jgi:hypothetical protein
MDTRGSAPSAFSAFVITMLMSSPNERSSAAEAASARSAPAQKCAPAPLTMTARPALQRHSAPTTSDRPTIM